MIFRDLKPGDNVYIIDKTKAEARVVKINTIVPSVGLQPGQIGQMGVYKDLTLDGINKSYTVNEIWDTALADNGNTVITPNMERALTEIKGIKKSCEDIINNIEHYKENITKCDKLLAEFDPNFKKEQNYEKRFSFLEDAVKNQAKDNSEIKEMLNKLLNK